MDEIVKTYVAKVRNAFGTNTERVQIIYETKSGKLFVQKSVHEIGEITFDQIND